MTRNSGETTLTQKIYEFVKTRGCATVAEITHALDVSIGQVRSAMRTLIARRLILPYRPQVGRGRIYCIPVVGDREFGRKMRINTSGMICITLPVDLIEKLDEIAVAMGKTRSSIIQQAVTELLNNYLRKDEPENKQEESQDDEQLDLIIPDR